MTDETSILAGTTAIVTHGATPIGRAISLGLGDHGAAVGVVESDPSTRADYEREFAATAATYGSPSIVVVPVVPTRERQALVDLALEAWIDECERPLRDARNAVQAAFTSMARPRGKGGCVVLVAATAALTGEVGLAAYATAAEGARCMARVVARGWGAHGITLHWVGAPTALFTNEDDAPRMAMWDPALGRGPDSRRDLASAIAALASPAMAFTTGTTTVVDGGLVMPT